MRDLHALFQVAAMAAVTIALRFLPFWIFRPGKRVPPLVEKLGALLPGAVMAMLVVYCLRGVSFSPFWRALPELIAAAVTVGLHLWRRSTLLSILGGTGVYMLLVQTLFA